MSIKTNLRETTRSNYKYMYDRFIRETFGQKKIADIKYSDVYQFYQYLLEKEDIQINTLETIHTLLHPTFQLAVLLGTGCRIGEALGLRWEDLDFDNGVISINHSLVYYPVGDNRSSILHVSDTKTEEGNRTIPMLDTVRDAFEMIAEEQEETGRNETVIDGMTGFVFKNRFGNVPNPQSVNRAIKRIISEYNSIEEVQAKKEKREPVILPNFSAHHLRHTFCTRLCENVPAGA